MLKFIGACESPLLASSCFGIDSYYVA
jgi:hypothetical protein